MSIAKIRSKLYKTARILGDIQAISSGRPNKMVRRVLRKRVGKWSAVYYNDRLDFYALTRFEDCHRAFIDWQTFSSARGTVLELMDTRVGGPLIIFMDPPRQTRLRNLVSKTFTPRRMAALEDAIREIARGYLRSPGSNISERRSTQVS